MRITTLGNRLMLQIGLMVAGMLIVGAVAIGGVNRIHQDFGITVRGFRELRSVYEIGFHIATAESLLHATKPDLERAQAAIHMAIGVLVATDQNDDAQPLPLSQWLEGSRGSGDELLGYLRQSESNLRAGGQSSDVDLPLQRSMQQLANLSNTIRDTIALREQAVASGRRTALLADGIICLLMTIAALWIGRRQYQAVMNPLDRLAGATRQIAAGDFAHRVAPSGDAEFASLAHDFNRMATELEELYRDLGEKIASASKELIRSERLASVGYLAAGVAHEINNPLGIITGYGERSLAFLERGLDENSSPKITNAIRIICEQAFRCKEITDRLLMLARPSVEGRRAVSLRVIAEEALVNIGGLPRYADRQFQLHCDSKQDFTVMANAGELKQVLVNLLVNAIEATETGAGQIEIALARRESAVELWVTDNGRGMTAETLQRVFEPFFTDKRSQQGTGLGLSISYAIVQDHGGRLSAESTGLGQGSRFSVILPAVK